MFVFDLLADGLADLADVVKNSEGLISDPYLQDMLSGKTKRQSLET